MKQIKNIIKLYVAIILLFLIQKPLFILFTKDSATTPIKGFWSTTLNVMSHGLTLDNTMAGYLCALPCILLALSVWTRHSNTITKIIMWYLWIPAFLISATFVLNIELYPYWNFPLDSTPLFYFVSSPADAFASTSAWVAIAGIIILLLLTVLTWLILRMCIEDRNKMTYPILGTRRKALSTFVMCLIGGCLFISIRGGITVSTANSGKVYYSSNVYENHAAVNPLFSLMESMAHLNDFDEQYRFMNDKEADKIFAKLSSTSDENTISLLNKENEENCKPNILVVIMESFASDLFPCLGGTQKNVTPQLDSIARNSILFTNFYANSFRTDRGLVCILSGYPAQPTTSIMKYTDKSSQLPSVAKALATAKNYKTAYYYGGDIDFAHQRSYLVSQGFEKIISDSDFPIEDKLSKWGVPDNIVAERLFSDIKQNGKGPWFRVFQTSSSHEPFDVPYKRLKDKRLNAFAFTDNVIGKLLREYSKLPEWKQTLVILVPDHVGAYKKHLNNLECSRYQIPLIITGGAISGQKRIDTIGSQNDIAATLLAQLKIRHDNFLFSKNLMSDKTPKFAFFTVPDAFGIVSKENAVIYDNKQQKIVYDKRGNKRNLKEGMAYLQKLYDDIASK